MMHANKNRFTFGIVTFLLDIYEDFGKVRHGVKFLLSLILLCPAMIMHIIQENIDRGVVAHNAMQALVTANAFSLQTDKQDADVLHMLIGDANRLQDLQSIHDLLAYCVFLGAIFIIAMWAASAKGLFGRTKIEKVDNYNRAIERFYLRESEETKAIIATLKRKKSPEELQFYAQFKSGD